MKFTKIDMFTSFPCFFLENENGHRNNKNNPPLSDLSSHLIECNPSNARTLNY